MEACARVVWVFKEWIQGLTIPQTETYRIDNNPLISFITVLRIVHGQRATS